MHNVTTVELTRDCEAVQIPHGTPMALPKGTSVDITQTLGGSYTIHAHGGLFRVASKDADALGLTPTSIPTTTSGEVNEQQVRETLRTCYDPEIPVNIVDLGLVYDMQLTKLPSGQAKVDVKMTLTAPGCGMGPTIAAEARSKIMSLPGVEDAVVDLVWDPPWNQDMISEAGKMKLGLI
jgi:probable FeS assembly SUF system protein SufT